MYIRVEYITEAREGSGVSGGVLFGLVVNDGKQWSEWEPELAASTGTCRRKKAIIYNVSNMAPSTVNRSQRQVQARKKKEPKQRQEPSGFPPCEPERRQHHVESPSLCYSGNGG